MRRITAGAALIVAISVAAAADIPYMVNHQGSVKVSGVPFTGTGFFKFGLVNASGNYVWTNDGTRLGTAASTAPVDAVTLGVTNGHYSVRLGDDTVTNMVAIPATVFNDNDVLLRVYFNDGVNGEIALSPDQTVTAVPYAFHAYTADTVRGHIDGGVLSNDTTDPTNSLHITDLICRDDQNTTNIEVATMSKAVDATWAAGDGNGGLDAGTIGTSQVLVYVYAIGDSTGEQPGDVLFSKSALTPGLPTGYDVKRFVGARIWLGGAWIEFLTHGNGRQRTTHHAPVEVYADTLTVSSTSVEGNLSLASVMPEGWACVGHLRTYANGLDPAVKQVFISMGSPSLQSGYSGWTQTGTAVLKGFVSSDWVGVSREAALQFSIYTGVPGTAGVQVTSTGYIEDL